MLCPQSDILTSLVLETLDDASTEEIEQHLIGCEICRTKLIELEQKLSDPIDKTIRKAVHNDRITQYFLSDKVEISGFKIIKKIGSGGMGIVYEAEDTATGTRRAVKILQSSKHFDPSATRRFQREKEAIGKLDHLNIVKSYLSDDPFCIVMDLLHGLPLDEYVQKNKPVPLESVQQIMIQTAQGLQYAHQSGIVHRDVKPSNIFVTDEGTVKILDLGLARISDTESRNHTLSHSDHIVGTLDFLSPEQIENTRNIDARSDIYSLGCTFFYLLCGDVPFAGVQYHNTASKLVGHARDTAPDIRDLRPDVSPALASVLAKMLENNPADRYQTAAEVIDAVLHPRLERTKRKTANWSLPISIFVSVTLSVLIIVLILFFTDAIKQEQQEKAAIPPLNPQPAVPDVVPNAAVSNAVVSTHAVSNAVVSTPAVSNAVVSTPAVSNAVVSDWGKNRKNVMPPRVFPCSISPNFSPGGLRVKSRVNDENVSEIEYSFDGETWQKAMDIQKGSAPPFVDEFYDFFVKNSADAEKIYVRYFDDKGNQSETFETRYDGKRFENIPPPITGNPSGFTHPPLIFPSKPSVK